MNETCLIDLGIIPPKKLFKIGKHSYNINNLIEWVNMFKNTEKPPTNPVTREPLTKEIISDLGLNVDEVAFYDALAENESAVRDLEDETLKLIAQELTQKLRKSIAIDWQQRDSVRAKMRNIIRITLRRYKYPPDDQQDAIELVMQQAEALSDEWSQTG